MIVTPICWIRVVSAQFRFAPDWCDFSVHFPTSCMIYSEKKDVPFLSGAHKGNVPMKRGKMRTTNKASHRGRQRREAPHEADTSFPLRPSEVGSFPLSRRHKEGARWERTDIGPGGYVPAKGVGTFRVRRTRRASFPTAAARDQGQERLPQGPSSATEGHTRLIGRRVHSQNAIFSEENSHDKTVLNEISTLLITRT